MAEVILDKVSKTYPGGFQAVKEFCLTIRDEEFIVLVGPSGCGKSTTLRMVAGLEDISGGQIRIGDRVVNEVAPKDRDIAMVFQNYALYPHMSVFKNMAFALMLRRKYGRFDNLLGRLLASGGYEKARAEREEIDRRVYAAAEMLGITNLLDRKPSALSGGQRQRVAVGRAIVREPKAFLFDEPLSNLDAKLRVEMRAELKHLRQRVSTTTIYVTHDQEEAMTLGDRVVVMKDGVVQQCDTPFVTFERPVNRFVAGFVGTPPMNFLEGKLVDESGLQFAHGTDRLPLAPEMADRMRAHVGKAVTLGVRPELLAPDAAWEHEAKLQASVRVTEPLGDRMDVHLRTAQDEAMTARIDARTALDAGGSVEMRVDMSRVHFFDTNNGQANLSLPS